MWKGRGAGLSQEVQLQLKPQRRGFGLCGHKRYLASAKSPGADETVARVSEDTPGPHFPMFWGISWLGGWVAGSVARWLGCWQGDSVAGMLAGWLAGLLAGGLVGLLAAGLACLLAYLRAVWLAGWV